MPPDLVQAELTLSATLAKRRVIRERVYREWLRGEQFTARLKAEDEYIAQLEYQARKKARATNV